MKKSTYLKNFYHILFLVVLVVVSFYYNYHEYLFYRPQSIHAWRQADCASLALNYYQGEMNFFHPEVHNLTSDNGTTGYCATSEVPVLYYVSAALYHVFGYNESIIRIINTLIFFLGLFYLFRLLLYLIKDHYWSIVLSLFFFASPVLVYYGNNYLTNVSAFSFSLVGWFYFFKFIHDGKKKLLLGSMLFFLLAGAFKVTAFFSLFAIIGYLVLVKTKLIYTKNPLLNKNSWIIIIPALVVIFMVGAWVYYANKYNKCHDCYYFSTTIFPIWTLDGESISRIITHIYKRWMNDYFHFSAHLLFLTSLIFVLANARKAAKFRATTLLLLVLQAVVYILLQFWTFRDHDYYTINLNIIPVFIVLTAFGVLKEHYPTIFQSLVIKIIIGMLLLFNIYHARKTVTTRYENNANDYYHTREAIYTITPYLREKGIFPSDKVIYVPDGSHVSLYLMNQTGWTQYTDKRFNKDEPITYNSDSAGIIRSIENGAKFMVVNQLQDLYLYPYLQDFTTTLVGKYGKALIFDLQDTSRNFSLDSRVIKDSIFSGAEDTAGALIKTSSPTYYFENAGARTDERSYQGKYSVKLYDKDPYGMTLKLNDIGYGESVFISVWRKGSKDARIIVSGPATSGFYHSDYNIVKKDTLSGWQKLEKELFLPADVEGEETKVYLYNPSKEPAYFDNFKIIRYKGPDMSKY